MAEFIDETQEAILAHNARKIRQVPTISRDIGELQAIFQHEMELSERLEAIQIAQHTAVHIPMLNQSAWGDDRFDISDVALNR